MRGERPADQPDPATQRHDAGKDVVPRPTTERVLVERVDLALDAFDEAEVAGDDLVDDGGHQSCRVHGTEARLAFGGRVEAVESLERTVVDGDHPAVAGHDVERATTGVRVLAVRIRRRFHRLEDQVDVVGDTA